MDTTALTVWQSYLRTSPADRRAALLRNISPELTLELEDTPPFDLKQGLELPEDELPKIHYSWFSPFLRSLPEGEIKLFLSVLTPVQIAGLKQSLLLSNNLPQPTQQATKYLRKTLFEVIAPEELLPVSCLPPNPLNALLELKGTELASLIDLLSMHDLSIEIRHIIETTKLKQIYTLLSRAQTTFLKTLLHKKEPVSFKKMGLLSWDGDADSLGFLLLQRGINRIAKSLYGLDPALLWHVAHRLDEEKGGLLITLCTALDHPHASDILSGQVLELVNTLKNTTPPSNL